MMFWKMSILFPLSVAILAQAFSAQNFVPFSHPFFSFALFAMAVYPGTNHAKVAYVAHVAKNTQNPRRVLAPGMEVKEGFATYQDAVYAMEDQLQFNEKYGVPMGLSEALSRLALVAHLFKGCEVGYKAEEKLAKELLIKALSTRRINTAPLEALMVELGIPTKGEAKSMLLQRLAAVQNVVQDDDGLPEVMACGDVWCRCSACEVGSGIRGRRRGPSECQGRTRRCPNPGQGRTRRGPSEGQGRTRCGLHLRSVRGR